MKFRRLFGLVFAVAGILTVTTPARADAVLDWNEVALDQVVATGLSPPEGARALAMVHVAMFDAINAIDRRYASFAFSTPAGEDSSPDAAAADAAAAAAAYTVLTQIFPERRELIAKAYTSALARVPDDKRKTAGIAIGERAGAACTAMRAGDGAGAPNVYQPRTSPGVYVSTALPVSSHWSNVKPWFMSHAAQFRPAPPPPMAGAVWARDYNEIIGVGALQNATRTPAQIETARFWKIVGPPSWNPIVRALAARKPARLVENARLFALVNMAASDAFVAVFEAKYEYHFWRPVTAIRNGDIDNNEGTTADRGWLPFVETPMHPEYPCAHCITASAVGTVLEAHFGTGELEPFEMTSATAPGVTHRWTRIADYVREVGNARVWSGVHFRSSTEVAETMGKNVGALALRNSNAGR
jgi:hypothetical protein